MFFISASTEIRIHTACEDSFRHTVIYRPQYRTKFVQISICNDDSHIALLCEHDRPQIITIKNRDQVRLTQTINVSNVTTLRFKITTKRHIALGTKSGDILLYDTKVRNVVTTFNKVCEAAIRSLDFTCDDEQLCGISFDVFFIITDFAKKGSVWKSLLADSPTCLKCHPQIVNRAGIGHQSGRITLWDLERYTQLVKLDILSNPIVGLTMSSADCILLISDNYLRICGVDFKTGELHVQICLEQEAPLTSVDLSKDGKFLAVGLIDGTVRLFDMKNQYRKLFSERFHPAPVSGIAFDNKTRCGKEVAGCQSTISLQSLVKPNELELAEPVLSPSAFINQVMGTSQISGDVAADNNQLALLNMRRSLIRTIKNDMDSLEAQLQCHLIKFQKFLDNEFEHIDMTTKRKWDIFKAGDATQIGKVLGSGCDL